MALKDAWKDKKDDQDYIKAEDINSIAQEVISIEEDNNKIDHSKLKNLSFEESGHTGFQSELTDEQLQNISDIPKKEDKSNKTTILNTDSTDEQYPSAGAVFREITGIAMALNESKADKTDVDERLDVVVGAINTLAIDKEDKSNKTTKISPNSTDGQYPSTKAVYDAINFELIESGTLEENVISIEPNFKGNKYKEIYFLFDIPTINADSSNATKGRYYLLQTDYSGNMPLSAQLWNNQGYVVDNYNVKWWTSGRVKMYGNICYSQVWFNKYYNALPNAAAPSGSTFSGGVVPYKKLDNPYLERFVVAFTSQTAGQRYLPAGTEYEFWGVKA